MDRQPVLEGERLLLRPLEADDWAALYGVASDRELWAGHPSHDRWREPVFRAFFDDALAKGGALAIIDKSTGKVIGSSRFQFSDREAEEGALEIGWSFLDRAYWGRGYNAEFKRLMLEHAFRFAESVIFVIGPQNLRSQKAVLKLGAVLTSETRPGAGGDSLVFRLTRAAFEKGQG